MMSTKTISQVNTRREVRSVEYVQLCHGGLVFEAKVHDANISGHSTV